MKHTTYSRSRKPQWFTYSSRLVLALTLMGMPSLGVSGKEGLEGSPKAAHATKPFTPPPGFSTKALLKNNPVLDMRYKREQTPRGLEPKHFNKEGELIDPSWKQKRDNWLKAIHKLSITGSEAGYSWISGLPLNFSWKSFLAQNPSLEGRYVREQSKNFAAGDLQDGKLVDPSWLGKRAGWVQQIARLSLQGKEGGYSWVQGLPVDFNWKHYLAINPTLKTRYLREQTARGLSKEKHYEGEKLTDQAWLAKRALWAQNQFLVALAGRESLLPWRAGNLGLATSEIWTKLLAPILRLGNQNEKKKDLAKTIGLPVEQLNTSKGRGLIATMVEEDIKEYLDGRVIAYKDDYGITGPLAPQDEQQLRETLSYHNFLWDKGILSRDLDLELPPIEGLKAYRAALKSVMTEDQATNDAGASYINYMVKSHIRSQLYAEILKALQEHIPAEMAAEERGRLFRSLVDNLPLYIEDPSTFFGAGVDLISIFHAWGHSDALALLAVKPPNDRQAFVDDFKELDVEKSEYWAREDLIKSLARLDPDDRGKLLETLRKVKDIVLPDDEPAFSSHVGNSIASQFDQVDDFPGYLSTLEKLVRPGMDKFELKNIPKSVAAVPSKYYEDLVQAVQSSVEGLDSVSPYTFAKHVRAFSGYPPQDLATFPQRLQLFSKILPKLSVDEDLVFALGKSPPERDQPLLEDIMTLTKGNGLSGPALGALFSIDTDQYPGFKDLLVEFLPGGMEKGMETQNQLGSLVLSLMGVDPAYYPSLKKTYRNVMEGIEANDYTKRDLIEALSELKTEDDYATFEAYVHSLKRTGMDGADYQRLFKGVGHLSPEDYEKFRADLNTLGVQKMTPADYAKTISDLGWIVGVEQDLQFVETISPLLSGLTPEEKAQVISDLKYLDTINYDAFQEKALAQTKGLSGAEKVAKLKELANE